MRASSWFKRFFDSPRLVCGLAGLMMAAASILTHLDQLIDLQTTNLFFKNIGARFAPDNRIVLLSIDDVALQILEPQFGRWPWPRTQLARLIAACQEARAIGVDILLPERDQASPQNDQELAVALRSNGRVALAGTFVEDLVRSAKTMESSVKTSPFPNSSRPIFIHHLHAQFLPPIPLFAGAAAAIGHANFRASEDQLLRAYSFYETTDRGLLPSLAIATLQAASLNPSVPGNWDDRELVYYNTPFARYSAVDILKKTGSRVAPAWMRDKLVLIGVEAHGLYDLRATPIGTRSGLEIHATALSNWLQGIRLLSLPPWIIWLGACLAGLLPLVQWDMQMRRMVFWWLLAGTGYIALAGLAFHFATLRLPVAAPLLASLAGIFSRLAIVLNREKQRRLQLEELQKMKQMLNNMLLHDLNAPLSNMIMLVESALSTANEKGQRRLTDALAEGRRLAELLHTLLDIQRMESGHGKLRLVQFNWSDLVQDTWRRLAAQAEKGELTPEISVEGTPSEMEGDTGMLGRVLQNLLDNALQHAAPQTTVVCKTQFDTPHPGWLTFRLMNHGPVIAPEDQTRIFEPFIQAKNLKAGLSRRHGLGLGLAFCKLAIFAHHGKLRCVSPIPEWNDGVAFEVALPLKQANPPDAKSPDAKSK
ncbi:MAG: CHASE2 and HATPase_c domain-containing protein [Verrucomicrobiae bacterium]|nr:CHASE2 and HATPase_c domain-containing protein [Verrucomicrobiae bacterium]